MQQLNTEQSSRQPIQEVNESYWNQLILALIRPPKILYIPAALSSPHLCKRMPHYTRREVNVEHDNQQLEVTIFESKLTKVNTIILYLHGNSSSRVEAVTLLDYIPSSYGLACFDFLGCGLTKEQYISLGVRESKQIQAVVNSLSKDYNVVIWGRSMGASSALKYGKAKIIIADSPFCSLEQVCKEVANSQKPNYIPGCLVSCLFPCVYAKLRSDINMKANFDLNQLDIKSAVRKIDPKTFIIFLSGKEDQLIHYNHSQKLFVLFPGENKRIFLFPGNHNSKRPPDILQKVMKLIEDTMNEQAVVLNEERIATNDVLIQV